MKQRVLLTLIMASVLGGMVLDRVLVHIFGAETIYLGGLIIGVALNAFIACAAYVRICPPRVRKDSKV